MVGQRWGRARQSMWRQLDVRACAPDHPAPVCDQFVRTRPTHSTARTRLVLRRAPSAWYRASSRRPDAARSCVGAIRAGAFVRVLSRWSRYTHTQYVLPRHVLPRHLCAVPLHVQARSMRARVTPSRVAPSRVTPSRVTPSRVTPSLMRGAVTCYPVTYARCHYMSKPARCAPLTL